MHIGLIGGIGPAATDLYYRGLIARLTKAGRPIELTMVHADASTLLKNFEARDQMAQVEIFLRLTERLKHAGADAVVITSTGGHFCVEPFEKVSPLPVLNQIGLLDDALSAMGMKTVGILGTDTVMATSFYGGLKKVKAVVQDADWIARIHRTYADMAIAGVATDQDKAVFIQAGRDLIADGAEVVLLGGTDLFMIFEGQDFDFKTLDCADIHLDAIAAWATEAAQS